MLASVPGDHGAIPACCPAYYTSLAFKPEFPAPGSQTTMFKVLSHTAAAQALAPHQFLGSHSCMWCLPPPPPSASTQIPQPPPLNAVLCPRECLCFWSFPSKPPRCWLRSFPTTIHDLITAAQGYLPMARVLQLWTPKATSCCPPLLLVFVSHHNHAHFCTSAWVPPLPLTQFLPTTPAWVRPDCSPSSPTVAAQGWSQCPTPQLFSPFLPAGLPWPPSRSAPPSS